MRLSVALLLLSAAGILGGAWLCGLLAFGIAVMCVALAVGVFGLLREAEARTEPVVQGAPTLHSILERQRAAP